jgi:hypothetical protein
MKRVLICLFVVLVASCATTKNITNYPVKFGIVDQRNSYPLSIEETNRIPWLRGVRETDFVAYVSGAGKMVIQVHYKVFRIGDDGQPKLMEESKYWDAKKGAYLSINLSNEKKYGPNVYGSYYFSIYVDSFDEPHAIIPFTVYEPEK